MYRVSDDGVVRAAGPSRRAVLGPQGSRRLVDPEGRICGGRGAARGRAARIRGGDRRATGGRLPAAGRGGAAGRQASSAPGRSRAISIPRRSSPTRSSSNGRRAAAARRAFPRSIAPNGSRPTRRGRRFCPASAPSSTGCEQLLASMASSEWRLANGWRIRTTSPLAIRLSLRCRLSHRPISRRAKRLRLLGEQPAGDARGARPHARPAAPRSAGTSRERQGASG